MDPRHRAPQALRGEPAEHTPAATRVRLAAVCLVLTGVGADEVYDTTAELRRVPNLFEILSYDYWHTNYGYEMPAAARERQDCCVRPARWARSTSTAA